tara:strand:- start:1061 stop:2686 length:1626 start_codon:yes stop_codon:yes gene_type:complete
MLDYNKFFPYVKSRKEQRQAIEFAINAIKDSDKRFVIIEAGTGVGKSAIGLTLSRYLEQAIPNKPGFAQGGYFLTTQKILQAQYEKDFGKPRGEMKSIYSASNYSCKFHKENDCRTSQQMLKTADRKSAFFKACAGTCRYKMAKKNFLESPESVTNFPYFLTEATYSGGITPRKILVIDEAHNTEAVLSNFVEVSVSQYFCEKVVKCKWPDKITPINFVKWISNVYFPKLQSQIMHFENQIEQLGLKDRIKELSSVALKYDMMTGHSDKLDKFLKDYDKDNWVMEKEETEKRGYVKVNYRAIDVSNYAEEYLFRLGQKVILMSATILNAEAFARSLGISKDDYESISIPSPFPVENRPIINAAVGSMSARAIEATLPQLKEAVKAIMQEHENEKGIIHCHTYRIANYLKNNIRGKLGKRILIHDSKNRDATLQKHMSSKEPTVLLSPSMTEGIDLKGDLSRFQVICKVPYPWLGDPIVKKRMHKFPNWYSLKTAITIVQAVGRSVRNSEDTAITYILDSDWDRFYGKNKKLFCEDFKRLIV